MDFPQSTFFPEFCIYTPLQKVAYYGKRQICNYRAPNLDSNTLDIYEQLLLKTFFDSVQKDPSQEQFTFRTLHSKSEKKNSSYVEKKIFFLQK